jgi:ketosteroid isomerase-like protein
VRPPQFIDGGTFVVVPGWLCGRGRESGAEVREPYAWVYRLRGGKVAEVWEHRDRREALEAVRLSKR